ICLAGDSTFRGHGLALPAHERKPVAYHAFARSSEQHERHRAIKPAWGKQNLWAECISSGMDYGDAAVDLRCVLFGEDAEGQLAVSNWQLARAASKPWNHPRHAGTGEGHERELLFFTAFDFAPQPGFGHVPVAHDCVGRDLQYFCYFIVIESTKEAQFDHFG